MRSQTAWAISIMLVLCFAICGCVEEQKAQERIVHEQFFNYTVHFCAQEDCIEVLKAQLMVAEKNVDCALYGVSDDLLGNLSKFKGARAAIVVDSKATIAERYVESGMVQKHKSKGIMHNKYCVIDNRTTITGSFNPTRSSKRDYNNLLIINSTTLAEFYQNDFYRLWQNGSQQAAPQGKRQQNSENVVVLNDTLVEAYFCQVDNCATALLRELRHANKSIIFVTYSFTDARIANELILQSAAGINVTGTIEKSTTGDKSSQHNALAANGVSIKIETSKKLMHHKYFVIDGHTVITGSFNPTLNADLRNDENLIIIKNSELAGKYVEEFEAIRSNR